MIYLNSIGVIPSVFPDGTTQIWKLRNRLLQKSEDYHIRFDFEHDGEIFLLCQLVDLIRAESIDYTITLEMPFLPYGRQDKDVNNKSTFALYTFTKIINSLRFDEVRTIDAHSSKAFQINKLKNVFPFDYIEYALNRTLVESIAFPDKGAHDRYGGKFDYPQIVGNKTRDQSTGYITDFSFTGEVKNKSILIVDDICDGGMTFIIMSKALYDAGAKTVHLYVTHGIFSKGLQVLRDAGIRRIFTKDGEV